MGKGLKYILLQRLLYMASKHLKRWRHVKGLHATDKRDSGVQASSYKINKSWRCI